MGERWNAMSRVHDGGGLNMDDCPSVVTLYTEQLLSPERKSCACFQVDVVVDDDCICGSIGGKPNQLSLLRRTDVPVVSLSLEYIYRPSFVQCRQYW
jgi:hypothetical protein